MKVAIIVAGSVKFQSLLFCVKRHQKSSLCKQLS
jgi:hypothetical protein